MRFNHVTTFLIMVGFLGSASISYAEELKKKENDEKNVHRLAPVDVYGQTENAGEIKLNTDTIKMTPSSTNSINDLFRGQSSIQFDANSRTGSTGGEITPPKISIHGAKHYENNFTINGISNNSNLNPQGFDSNPAAGSKPTGDSQGIFVDPNLFDSVEVYTENISAQYGDFVGGVVNATLRDASLDGWHGGASVRGTTHGFTEFHYTPNDFSDVNSGVTAGKPVQPKFYKGSGNVYLEGPIYKNSLGLMLSYSQQYSLIPKTLLVGNNQEVDEHRSNQNFLVRINTNPDDKFYAALTAIYAPYEGVFVSPTYKDGGEFSMKGGGTQFILNTRYTFDFAKWSNDFGYSMTEVSRDSDSTLYSWNKSKVEIWATQPKNNQVGGFGDYEMNQDTLSWKSVLDVEPIGDTVIHSLLAGFEFKHVVSKTKESGYVSYMLPKDDPNAQGSMADGVIAGEQFATLKNVQSAMDKSLNYSSIAVFLEDEIEWGHVTFRPGVRVSYDDLMENTDVAPRLFANYDILNDDRFNIYGGYNRYYGSQVLDKILSFQNPLQRYNRKNSTDPWEPQKAPTTSSVYDLAKLDNPYTDEYTVGASANVFDILFKLGFTYREYEDQLTATTYQDANKLTHIMYNNGGSSKYKGITLSAEHTFVTDGYGTHNVELSATWSETKGSAVDWTNSAYDENMGGGKFDPDFIYLNGQQISRYNLPASNFNSPWVLAYTHNATFWDERLKAFLQVRWEKGGKRLIELDPIKTTGLWYRAYAEHDQENMLNADLKLSLDMIRYENQTLALELEALNLLNSKNIINTTTSSTNAGSYSLGRQFYLGLKYTF